MKTIISIIVLSVLLFPFSLYAGLPEPSQFSADLKNYPNEISGYYSAKYIFYDELGEGELFADDKPLTYKIKGKIYSNRNGFAISNKISVIFAFTKYSVNMTMLPTNINLNSGNILFDSNQYTRLKPSTPIAILHISSDKKFIYAQSPEMRGWIPAESVNIIEEEKLKKIISSPFITIIKENAVIGGVNYNLGSIIYIKEKNISQNIYTIYKPDGATENIKNDGSFIEGSLDYDGEKMKFFAESLLGEPYDWGGKEGFRDCSLYVKDLWRIFGRDLPRNSYAQSKTGKIISEKPESKEEFYKILDNAAPYKTLIFFKGHVMMYGGKQINDDIEDYVIYHAVNRLAHDNGEVELIAAVVKTYIFSENFSDIWKRVVKIIEIE